MPFGLMNRIPYTLPETIAPPGTRCIQITIPDDDEWENDLYSLIAAEFGRWLMWERDVGKNGTKVAARWRAALKTWKHCTNAPKVVTDGMEIDEMAGLIEPYCDDQGNCRFHFRCDICGDWHDVATASDTPAPGQPGPGQPQPPAGGGTQTYCTLMPASGGYLLPTHVNTGDVLTITSATGATNDKVESDWRCPDGNVFSPGQCNPGTVTDGSDQLPSSPHMSLIARVAGTYHPLYPGAALTIPGGVSDGRVEIQLNNGEAPIAQGAVTFCVKVTNNQAATWTHRWLGGHGLGIITVGSVVGDGLYDPGNDRIGCTLDSNTFYYGSGLLNFSSRTITRIKMNLHQTGNAIASNSRSGFTFDSGFSDGRFLTAYDAGDYVIDTGPISEAHNYILMVQSNRSGGTSGYFTSVEISGLGTDPF